MEQPTTVLPAGYVLADEYVIERVLGQGGFGITYLAHDNSLQVQVAIKEFFPASLASRTSQATLRPHSSESIDALRWGKDRFIREAQTLAQFRHPSIVRVKRWFEANNTAYAVLDFEDGRTLKALLDDGRRRLTQDEVDRLLVPMLDALELLHNKGWLHRDISPDNIIVRPDGIPVLIDFGAVKDLHLQQAGLTYAMVKRGYSPIEQYQTDTSEQGAWTDIYALAATLYECITGKLPPEAAQRLRQDTMAPIQSAAAAGFRPAFLAALDRALAVHRDDRLASVAEWRMLAFEDGVPTAGDVPAPPHQRPPVGSTERLDPSLLQRPMTATRDEPPGPRSPPTTPPPPAPERTPRPVGRIAAVALSLLLIGLGVALAIPATRDPLIAMLPRDLQCALPGSPCVEQQARAAFDTALACIETTPPCDADKSCYAPARKAIAGSAGLANQLEERVQAAAQRCAAGTRATVAPPATTAPPAGAPPLPKVPAALPAAPALPSPAPSGAPGATTDTGRMLAQLEACLKATPCNPAGCRTSFEQRLEAAVRVSLRERTEAAFTTALTACASQRELSAFAELKACARSHACQFEVECLSEYRALAGTRDAGERGREIEQLRADAKSSCQARPR